MGRHSRPDSTPDEPIEPTAPTGGDGFGAGRDTAWRPDREPDREPAREPDREPAREPDREPGWEPDREDVDPGRYLRNDDFADTDTDPDLEALSAEAVAGGSGGHSWRVGRSGDHRSDGGSRGVSVGVIAALVAVIVGVGAVIGWRFFGDTLAHRTDAAAGRCVAGELAVAVVADPSIADHLQEFADRFNKSAKPVGDRCVSVRVKPADSDAVVAGFIGEWPAQLGERPALWVPGSSISTARLQASVGREAVGDARSLVTSPVLLAIRPELGAGLAQQSWASLPGLQTDPDALSRLGLPGWGSLRLALPLDGNADAAYLAAEAVAAAAPPDAGTAPVRTLAGGAPKLADSSLAEAMNVLLRRDDPAAAPVHAVITTEQQLFTRGKSVPDAASMLSGWLPPGPVPVADYPTVLLNGSWLSAEQISAASEFARFAHKAEQRKELATAGFRVDGVAPPSSDVTDFPALPDTLSVGEDAARAALANLLTAPAGSSAVTLMLDRSMTVEELANVVAAVGHRIQALPPGAAVGLWTFDGVEAQPVLAAGALDEPVNGQPRAAALVAELNATGPAAGGAVSFTTLRRVYTDALANYLPGQNNSILVLAAGPHTDRTLDGAGLQDFLRQAADPQRPIAVNVVDFGDDPDRGTWQAVAALTGGQYQNVARADSPELPAALMTLLS